MAYFALSLRDSTLLLPSNASPGQPSSSRSPSTSSRPRFNDSLTRPFRLHSSSLLTDCQRFRASVLSNRTTRSRTFLASIESNVTVEEPVTEFASLESTEDNTSETAADEPETTASSSNPANPPQTRNPVQRRAGGPKPPKNITVQKEQLVPGAIFSGPVRAVQAYGAFVDIGAFTDGLVHISELSSAYVRNVQDVVSVGQIVTVRIIEMDEKAGRIALTMRDKDSEVAAGESEEQSSGSAEGGEPRRKIAGRGASNNRGKQDDNRKATKLMKGQELKGKVKNIIRSGAFIEFEDGEEGYLRGSEITEGGENVPMETLLTVGQEVNVRVLKIERGKANLTMKAQVDMKSINKSINKNVNGDASNPFEIFFRNANLIPETPFVEDNVEKDESAAVEEILAESVPEAAQTDMAAGDEKVIEDSAIAKETETVDVETPFLEEQAAEESGEEIQGMETIDMTTSDQSIEEVPASNSAEEVGASGAGPVEEAEESPMPDIVAATLEAEQAPESALGKPLPNLDNVLRISGGPEDALPVPEVASVDAPPVESSPIVAASAEPTPEPGLTLESVDESVDPESPASKFSLEEQIPDMGGSPLSVLDSLVMVDPLPVPDPIQAVSPLTIPDPVQQVSPPAVPNPPLEVSPFQDSKMAKPVNGPTALQVKELRETSGAGMMECKKALVACDSDMAKAIEYLRKKGLASADKKVSRVAAEGRVGSYVHDGRMGTLIEVNCETDFVSRGDQFKGLVADMGMQVIACPGVQYVSVDDVAPEFVQKEREIEMGKDDLANKPPQIREKIVEGRVAKRLAELALLEQPYIRDDKILVKDIVKQTIATLGEKVQVRRFVRFNLGEGLQKKSADFAAEVAAAAKVEVATVKDTEPVKEAKIVDDSPKVAVPAARVKELRDATGAGMMDCKKALAACENDVQKATEFLRKKGLASAEKKGSRVASEGLIGSYIHDGRIGVLIEVNSETDFVARSVQFKELVSDLGMQVAACPEVQYVTVDEIPIEFVEKEKETEAGKEDLAKKPEAVRSKIVEGRISKTLNKLALLEQPYIKDDTILVKDHIKQTISLLGENIQVRRFARFYLGEGIEKRSTDFAAEVAAQTAAKF